MVRSPTSLLRLLVGITVTVFGIAVTWRFSNTMAALNDDWEHLAHMLPAWIRAIPTILVALILLVVPLVVNLQLLRYRRIRLLAVVNLAAIAAFGFSEVLVSVLTRQPPSLFPRAYTDGSVNDPLLAAFTAAFVVGVPYLPRSARRLGTATIVLSLLATLGFAEVPAVAWFVDVGLGITCGAAVALLFGTPDSSPDRRELIDGLARSGIVIADIHPAAVDARGSVPWLGSTTGGDPVFVKVLGADNRSADLMFRAFRMLFLRNSGDERPMSSLRRSVEHEALLSMRAAAIGVTTPELLTVSDLGDDAMLLAFEGIDGDSLDRLDPDHVTDELLDEVWRQVALLQTHGIAHRDLRLANIFVGADGRLHLIDFGFAELAASPLLLATDLAELVGSSATVVGVDRAVDAAERAIGADGLALAHTRLHPAALGGATRSALKDSGELPVLREAVASRSRRPGPVYEGTVPTNSWPAVAWFAFASLVTIVSSRLASTDGALARIVEGDQAAWTVVAALVGLTASIVASRGSQRDPLDSTTLVLDRLAAGFAELLAPLHTANVALRVRVLLSNGIETTSALGSVGVAIAVRAFTHLAVLYLTVRMSGTDGSIDLVVDPDPGWVAATAAGLAVLVATALLGPVRRAVARDVVVPVRHASAGLRALTGRAAHLVQLFVGSMFVPFALVGALVAADRAVGGTLDPPSIALAVLVVTLVAALLPVPGGAGITEAGLVAALVILGERGAVAVSAVVLFRIVSMWLPAAAGWWALRRLRATGRLGTEEARPQSADAASASGS